MPTRSRASWGLALSLLLHGMGIAALSLALPRLNVRPGAPHPVDVSVLSAVEPAPLPAAESASETSAAELEVTRAAAPVPAPRPARKPTVKPPLKAATPSKLPSSERADPRSDGSALERVLRQIATTTELTQDQRRRAMLTVLRTWEDPSGQRSADELIDALLRTVREPRAAPP